MGDSRSKNSSEGSKFRRLRRRVGRGEQAQRAASPKSVHKNQVGAMKVLRLLLLLILLGTRVEMVRAVEEEISTRKEMDRILENVLVHRADSSNRCVRMKFCVSDWKVEEVWQERTRRDSQEMDLRTMEEHSLGRDPRTPQRKQPG